MIYTYILYYLIALVLLVTLDYVWLGVIAGHYYRKHLGYLFDDKLSYGVAAIFYLIYAAAIILFVIEPSLTARPERSLLCVGLYGAALGLTAYSAYNLTNLSTIRHWPIRITLIDMLWGTSSAVVISTLAVWLIRTVVLK